MLELARWMLAASVLLLGCATHEQIRVTNTPDIPIESLAVLVEENGEFEVYSARLADTATGAVLFGFVGAAVESGVADSRDRGLEEQIGEGLYAVESAALLRASIRDTFARESDIRVEMLDAPLESGGAFDAVGRLEIQEYGFTLTDRDAVALHPFVLLDVKVVGRDGTVIWDDREKIIGSESATIAQLSAEKGLARRMIGKAIRNAGAKVAYGVIYQ